VAGQVLSEFFTNRKENIPLTFSEDCLYLNIYTPADLTKSSRLPVSMGTTCQNLPIPSSGITRCRLGEGNKGSLEQGHQGPGAIQGPRASFHYRKCKFSLPQFPPVTPGAWGDSNAPEFSLPHNKCWGWRQSGSISKVLFLHEVNNLSGFFNSSFPFLIFLT
jgi:hypothetical protein